MDFALEFALSMMAAAVPAAILLVCFYKADRHPEPISKLVMTFLLGVGIVVPDYYFAEFHASIRPHIDDPLGAALYVALFVAAIPEELGKFLVIRFYAARQPSFDEPMDGVVYGAVAALGFATIENIQHIGQGAFTLAIVRGLTAIPAHACFGATQGYFLGQSRFRGGSRWLILWGLGLAILFHTLYDFPLLALRSEEHSGKLLPGTPAEIEVRYGLSVLFVLTLALECFWTYRLVSRLRREQAAALPKAP